MQPTSPNTDDGSDFEVDELVSARYRIIARLGRGGMGTAYRAWDCVAGRPVVLKHPRREVLETRRFRERFNREAEFMAALSHPNIVPITAIGEHRRLPYLVMPFLPGGSLSHRRLRDGDGVPLPMLPHTLHLWLPQVAAALDFIHDRGIVHRDVKPANIFFDGRWQAFLGDFGIAKMFAEPPAPSRHEALTAERMVVGTPEYMPPEMFSAGAAVDGRADQYALAVVVYEMLAGRRPFTGDTAHIILEVTSRKVPPLVDHQPVVPPTLERAVLRAMAKHPNDRFRSCREFTGQALQAVPPMDDDPGVARLLCPQCDNLLKLPAVAAGRSGRCPRCRARMQVSHDLGALWLATEETKASPPGRHTSRGGARPTAIPPGRRTAMIATATGLLVAILFWFLHAARVDGLRREMISLRDQLHEARGKIDERGAPERNALEIAAAGRPPEQEDAPPGKAGEMVAAADEPEAEPDDAPPQPPVEPVARPRVRVPLPDTITNSVGMTLRLCPRGSFVMGKVWDLPVMQRRVTLTRPFYIGVHEVTNADWRRIAPDMPSRWQDDDHPVHGATWQQAVDFCRRLSAQAEEQAARRTYRLPSEAEWEYACRAGTSSPFSFGTQVDQLGAYAWYRQNAGLRTHPVGEKLPNPWQLHDMHGNVLEWCSDWFEPITPGSVADPGGPARGFDRVCRGGSWAHDAARCTAVERFGYEPTSAGNGEIGFRVVFTPEEQTP